MDTRLRALAGRQGGTFSVHEVMRLGVDHAELRRAVRDSELVCVRRGAYVVGSRWREASADERYRLKATAVARTRPEDGLSHHAALAVHGLPLWDHDLGRVDLVSGVRQAVNRGGIWLHPAAGVELTDVGGVQAVPVARAVVRTALTMGTAAAVVAGDAALHSGL
ncbi:MAG TPA: type IV toxin-antitoxin system AbiEi family antitoxin domain-containing protein, partial [Intrasporangium sp.]|nr:type IV toxin-antitoxin system AbiEi family antitoxin domain-containing protein [Intrasporangium sp.]